MTALEDFEDARTGWELAKMDVEMFNRRAKESQREVERYHRLMIAASKEIKRERELIRWEK